MQDILNRWSCEVPCDWSTRFGHGQGKIVSLDYCGAVIAQPSCPPPRGARMNVVIHSDAFPDVCLKGRMAYKQEYSRGPFLVEFEGSSQDKLKKLATLFPLLRCPEVRHARPQERRAHYRWPLSIPCESVTAGFRTTYRTIDLSFGGALLEGLQSEPSGSEITLRLGYRKTSLRARILRVQEDEELTARFAIRFSEPAHERSEKLIPIFRHYVLADLE